MMEITGAAALVLAAFFAVVALLLYDRIRRGPRGEE